MKKCIEWNSVRLIHPPKKVTRHGIFLSWWWALKSFLSAKWSSMARESTLLLLLVCLGHVLTQDVADCTWQPKQDAVESTSLECHLKTLQTGPAVIPQVSHHRQWFHSWPSYVVYLLVSLAKLWMCEKEGIQLSKPELSCIQTQPRLFTPATFLFGFWIRNLPVSVVWTLLNGSGTKKVFFLIWQSTNVVICFGQVKSYARLDSELTLIFRRLPTTRQAIKPESISVKQHVHTVNTVNSTKKRK